MSTEYAKRGWPGRYAYSTELESIRKVLYFFEIIDLLKKDTDQQRCATDNQQNTDQANDKFSGY